MDLVGDEALRLTLLELAMREQDFENQTGRNAEAAGAHIHREVGIDRDDLRNLIKALYQSESKSNWEAHPTLAAYTAGIVRGLTIGHELHVQKEKLKEDDG